MFSEERLTTIFGNMEAIYRLSQQFLAEIDKHVNQAAPHTSQLGQCFLIHVSNCSLVPSYVTLLPPLPLSGKEGHKVMTYRSGNIRGVVSLQEPYFI